MTAPILASALYSIGALFCFAILAEHFLDDDAQGRAAGLVVVLGWPIVCFVLSAVVLVDLRRRRGGGTR